ncbi:MAG: PP2C family protein-serine/threonine phosphatase [Spirochaetota bacterium]
MLQNTNHSKGKSTSESTVRFSLKLKFALAIMLITVTVITSMSLYFIRHESRILTSDIIETTEGRIRTFELIVSKNLGYDELAIYDMIELFKGMTGFRYAYVINMEHTVTHASAVERIGMVQDDERFSSVAASNSLEIYRFTIDDPESEGGKIYDFIYPVYSRHDDTRISYVRMGFSDNIIRERIAQITRIILITAAIFIALSLVAALILAVITTRPLNKLSEGVRIIGTGNLDHKIVVRSRDEIGSLANQFNAMTSELKDAREKEIENRIMEEQLDLAREIQEGLNPMDFYNKRGIEIKGFTRAAKGVGGDYFDYIDIDENRVGALISDVSGKGIPASLVMVMIRTVFVAAIRQDPKYIQCKNIVAAINDSLSADFAIDKFATLFFMIYDRQSETLAFSNAGHGPLFCYRANKNRCTVTTIEGVPIGIMDEVEYNQTVVQFGPGDIVVLYTDGITEMRNPSKEEYGRTRLQKLIIDNSSLDAEKLVDVIVGDVEAFREDAPPHDDMTTLVLKRSE